MRWALIVTFGITAFVPNTRAQLSQLAPWASSDPNNPSPAYRPEPILFMHGVNDNDAGWGLAITNLLASTLFYQSPATLPPQSVGGVVVTRAPQYPFLHTFNYGDPPGTNSFNRQTFDPVMWNAWEPDLHGSAATNRFHNPQIWGPLTGDARKTLDKRIDDIRTAYAITINGVQTKPNIVLVAHSLGALLSHYYLLKNPTGPGVRRLVTIAGAHQGSLLANWLTWYRAYGASDQSFDGHKVPWAVEHLYRWRGPQNNTLRGIFEYWNLGSVQNAVMLSTQGAFVFRPRNPFLEYFWNTPAPKIEYVFNAYQMPLLPGGSVYQDLRTLVDDAGVDEVFLRGDGFVPTRSALAKDGPSSPSIWNGSTNVNSNIHATDPVLYGIWTNLDHTAAVTDTNSLNQSLFGVPYRWPGASSNQWPTYAQSYGENQSFSKYFNAPASNSVAYTDEPGIAGLRLLYNRTGGNPLLIPSLNTWTTNSSGPQKTLTNYTDFVGHQIVTTTDGGNVRYPGITGAKNSSQNPVGVNGTNYWITAGNEYLPASLVVRVDNGVAPNHVATNFVGLIRGTRMVTNCLVQLSSTGVPQYEYGYFDDPSGSLIYAGTNNYFSAQGYNLAKLLTPQAEQAFDCPVDSTTLVSVLQKINQGEAISNVCPGPLPITRWTASVSEWLTVPNSGTATLDFFPTSSPASGNVRDAWTTTTYNGWTYNAANKTVTFTNVNSAPSQVVVSNLVYLGCKDAFTTNYGSGSSFTVPALTNDGLAGIQITATWLTDVRQRLEAVIPRYKNTFISGVSSNWTKADIIKQADPNHAQTDWTPIVSNQLLPQHFTELKAVADLLTVQSDGLMQSGLVNPSGHGWQSFSFDPSSGMSAQFIFEDSQNCSGNNNNTQTGSCCRVISFSATTTVSYQLSGNTERQDAGYDQSSILRDGTQKVHIGSTEEGLGCTMANHTDSNTETLAPGTYQFTFVTGTVDPLYHVGMTHGFSITFTP